MPRPSSLAVTCLVSALLTTVPAMAAGQGAPGDAAWPYFVAYALGVLIVLGFGALHFDRPTFVLADKPDGRVIWPVPPRFTTPRLTYTIWMAVYLGMVLLVFVLMERALARMDLSELFGEAWSWIRHYPPVAAAVLLAGFAPAVPGTQQLLRGIRDFCHRSASIPDHAKGRYTALRAGVDHVSPGDRRRARELVRDGVVADDDFDLPAHRPEARFAQALHLLAAAMHKAGTRGSRYAQTVRRPELRLRELQDEARAIADAIRPDADSERRFGGAIGERIEALYAGALQFVVCVVHGCERSEAGIARCLGDLGFAASVAAVGIRFSLTPIVLVGAVLTLVLFFFGLVLWLVMPTDAIRQPVNSVRAVAVLWGLLFVPTLLVFALRSAAAETWWPFRMAWEPRPLLPLLVAILVGAAGGVGVMGVVELIGILGDDKSFLDRLPFAAIGPVVALAAAFALDEPLGIDGARRRRDGLVFAVVLVVGLCMVTFIGLLLFFGRPSLDHLHYYVLVAVPGLLVGGLVWFVAGRSASFLGVRDAVEYALVKELGDQLAELSDVAPHELDGPALRHFGSLALVRTDLSLQRFLEEAGLATPAGALTTEGAARLQEVLGRAHRSAARPCREAPPPVVRMVARSNQP